jgi:hypothetical protein
VTAEPLEVAWSTRSDPAMVLRCGKCRTQLGYVCESDAGALAVLVNYPPALGPQSRQKAADRKTDGLPYSPIRPVEIALLSDWKPITARCRCGRGESVVKLEHFAGRWESRKKSADI